MDQNNRVLSRRNARCLTEQELEIVKGSGPEHTNNCSFDPRTGMTDGDAC